MENQALLFRPLKIKSITLRNRIWVSPMCQYSSRDGHPTDWHYLHLGSRAVGGAGLIVVEATAVSPEGRISPDDSGIWSDAHTEGFARLVQVMKAHGATPGIQLAHAGRKASTAAPWLGGKSVLPGDGGWVPVGPSAIAFDDGYQVPSALTREQMNKVVADFEKATDRTLAAGFEVNEIHMAHGYLLHEFLSPVSNQRQDEYGGSLENRMRFPLEVARAVRKRWPERLPLFVRISATDWSLGAEELKAIAENRVLATPAWGLTDSITFCRKLKEEGIDLIDCSSGANLAKAQIPVGPNYQVPFAMAIRRETGLLTAAVGLITESRQAEAILQEGQADAIFMAREFLRDPYFPLRAARELGAKIDRPKQYGRS